MMRNNIGLQNNEHDRLLDLLQEIERTKEELKLAEQHLDNAEGEFIDVAIYEIHALRKKLQALYRKARGECA